MVGLHTRAGAPAWRLDMTSVSLVRAGLTLAHFSAETTHRVADGKSEAPEHDSYKVLQQVTQTFKAHHKPSTLAQGTKGRTLAI